MWDPPLGFRGRQILQIWQTEALATAAEVAAVRAGQLLSDPSALRAKATSPVDRRPRPWTCHAGKGSCCQAEADFAHSRARGRPACRGPLGSTVICSLQRARGAARAARRPAVHRGTNRFPRVTSKFAAPALAAICLSPAPPRIVIMLLLALGVAGTLGLQAYLSAYTSVCLPLHRLPLVLLRLYVHAMVKQSASGLLAHVRMRLSLRVLVRLDTQTVTETGRSARARATRTFRTGKL